MKKFLSCFLCVVMILTTLSLTSCGGDKKVDTINGVDPEEALANALEMIEEADRYSIVADIKFSLGIGFLSTNVFGNDIYIENYDGNNHYISNRYGYEDCFTGSLLKDFVAEAMAEVATEIGYDELWCYDGVYYVRNGSNKEKNSISYIESSDFDILMNNLFDNVSEYECFVDYLGYYYMVVELDESSSYVEEGDTVTLTIYFNKDGSIKRIVEVTNWAILTNEMIRTYMYGLAAPEVTPPDDMSSYKTSNSWYN